MTKAQLRAAYDTLKAEADAMRAELAERREHVCPFFGPTAFGPQCTCGMTVPCQAHPLPFPGQVWVGDVPPYQGWTNVCAGGAATGNTLILDTASGVYRSFDGHLTIRAGACAGAPPMIQTFWVTT